MIEDVLSILQACDTIKELSSEFNKKFGWVHFIQKKKCEKLKTQLKEKIKNIKNDVWDYKYIETLERILLTYYDKLEPYLEDIYISDHDNPNRLLLFKPLYFFNKVDGVDKYIYVFDIINTSINVMVYDVRRSVHLKYASEFTINGDCKYAERVCKAILINMLCNYIDGIYNLENKTKNEILLDQLRKEFPLDFFKPDVIVEPLPDNNFEEK